MEACMLKTSYHACTAAILIQQVACKVVRDRWIELTWVHVARTVLAWHRAGKKPVAIVGIDTIGSAANSADELT